MSTVNTFSTPGVTVGGTIVNAIGNLNGLFKETYQDKLNSLIPEHVKLLNLIKFVSKEKQPGNLFHSPVILGLEHGVTFGSSSDDAIALNDAIAGSIKDCQVRGCPIVLRSQLGYAAASRAAQGGTQAFMDATKFLVANMLRSITKKLEIEMLYGNAGYATITDASVAAAVVTIPEAQWAPGIWAGAENMPIEIRKESDGTLVGSYSVTKVDMTDRKITLDAAPGAMAAGDYVIWHKGAYGKSFLGIHKILTTKTGILFNIDVANYALFQASEYDAGNAELSFAKLNLAAARAVEKGLEGKLVAFVNPRAWADMMGEQAALRKYDGSWNKTKLETGSEAITYYSQNGEISIIPSIYIKAGFAYMLSMDDWMRVGSTDVTFKRPGRGDEFFRDMENSMAYELRLYTDQALFCQAVGRNVIISNIKNKS